jgi:hypothetical protein
VGEGGRGEVEMGGDGNSRRVFLLLLTIPTPRRCRYVRMTSSTMALRSRAAADTSAGRPAQASARKAELGGARAGEEEEEGKLSSSAT